MNNTIRVSCYFTSGVMMERSWFTHFRKGRNDEPKKVAELLPSSITASRFVDLYIDCYSSRVSISHVLGQLSDLWFPGIDFIDLHNIYIAE